MEAANLESLKQEFSISVEDVDRWVCDVRHWAATEKHSSDSSQEELQREIDEIIYSIRRKKQDLYRQNDSSQTRQRKRQRIGELKKTLSEKIVLYNAIPGCEEKIDTEAACSLCDVILPWEAQGDAIRQPQDYCFSASHRCRASSSIAVNALLNKPHDNLASTAETTNFPGILVSFGHANNSSDWKAYSILARQTLINSKASFSRKIRLLVNEGPQQQAFNEPGARPSSHLTHSLPASAQPFTAALPASAPCLLVEIASTSGADYIGSSGNSTNSTPFPQPTAAEASQPPAPIADDSSRPPLVVETNP
ncbi:hypothetical protein ROHU_009449 [Labeo rohita]|uniref:Uncharacterized protein n=1 Tax=Labeo rohita TaxID=84645 RepID=A0A498M9H1_LABRO|nr:hypothetical protein ROHU_009449 [Labeo rohita]